MADWLRLPSGQAVNMDRSAEVRGGENDDLNLVTTEGNVVVVGRAAAQAVHRYLEDRTYGGERAPRQR